MDMSLSVSAVASHPWHPRNLARRSPCLAGLGKSGLA